MIRRRKRLQPMVTLTPVMDVVFLLIIFFILSSHFVQGDVDKLSPAQSPDIEVIERAAPYSVSIDADGVVRSARIGGSRSASTRTCRRKRTSP